MDNGLEITGIFFLTNKNYDYFSFLLHIFEQVIG